MRTGLLILGSVLIVPPLLMAPPLLAAETIDRVVAVVNAHTILLSEWDTAVRLEALMNQDPSADGTNTLSASATSGAGASNVGVVLQGTGRNLLPYLSAAENVMLPMTYTGIKRSQRRARAEELLDLLSVGHCRDRTPDTLSGGEQQRVAVAVANANEPRVLFADEPTGELDTATSDEVFAALRRANEDLGVTVVVVTHDALVSEQVQRTVRIRNGRTSTEVLRRVATGEDGVEVLTAEEYAVLDASGRLQLPGEFTERLHLRKRVRLALESDHIGVWPDEAARRAKSDAENAENVASGGQNAESAENPESAESAQ